MPRLVDHDSRRRQIADAVCHLADEHGLEGVTLRDVAARAQVSMGAVQRCFHTKEEMLVFALSHVSERIGRRAEARLAESPVHSSRTALEHAATEISLLREEYRPEARVWLAFVAQAMVSPPLAKVLRGYYTDLQELFARLIGEAADIRDPQHEARVLLALTDGLTVHILFEHLSAETALSTLEGHLARLWGEVAH